MHAPLTAALDRESLLSYSLMYRRYSCLDTHEKKQIGGMDYTTGPLLPYKKLLENKKKP